MGLPFTSATSWVNSHKGLRYMYLQAVRLRQKVHGTAYHTGCTGTLLVCTARKYSEFCHKFWRDVMKRVVLAVFLSAILVLAGCGGGGNSSITSSPTSANTTINFGDATNDQVIGFELLINSITLSGGSNPSVLPKPTEFEFVHAAGILEPLSLISVPSGTYTGATIGVANP